MHDHTGVLFGWDPLWLSAVLFIATYVVIVTEKINRAIVALIGAGLMITLGVLNQEAAIRGIDFNTLGLLTGMIQAYIFAVLAMVYIASATKVYARSNVSKTQRDSHIKEGVEHG